MDKSTQARAERAGGNSKLTSSCIGKVVKLDISAVLGTLQPGGVLSRSLPGYEPRSGQVRMAETVAGALVAGRIAIIEAGTGTGKSLAYLIPAIYWAVATRQKVIVSTNTITLQEQLITKDIPFLAGVLDIPFQVAVVKGWNNYLCWYRLLAAGRDSASLFTADQNQQLTALTRWARESETGCRTDLPWEIADEVWSEVCAASDVCLRQKCEYYESCFYFAERRRAAAADIIIVNHHLLFADLALRQILGFETKRSVLPPYRHVIWDEAHHIEDVATDHFGCEVSRVGMARLLGRLLRRQGSIPRGLLPRLHQTLQNHSNGLSQDRCQAVNNLVGWEMPVLLRRLQDLSEKFFKKLKSLVEQNGSSTRETVLPLPQGWGGCFLLRSLENDRDEFLTSLQQLENALKQLSDSVNSARGSRWEGLKVEVAAVAGRVSESIQALQFLCGEPDDRYVYWAAVSGKRQEPRLAAVPIEVGEILREGVFRHLRSAVFTSATLAVGDSFAHLRERLGIIPNKSATAQEWGCLVAEPLEKIIPSPFPYQDQVLLCIPSDLTAPRGGRFEGGLAEYIRDILLATSGRAFVLFTSYQLLHEVYEYCRGPLQEAGITALCQGRLPRGLLLRQFQAETGSVLFGTSSFWEGVDMPGETLSCVIITKLPFHVPTEPVIAARMQRLEEAGHNAFYSYLLPQAVIKFKQGFGRLIRRATDRGVVVVCDTRLISRSYGQLFLSSLPDCQIIIEPGKQLLPRIRAWLGS